MEENKKSGLSTASLVLGIISIVFSFIPFLNFLSIIMGILSIIFGIIGIVRKAGKGVAIAGFILGIISIIITYNFYKNVSDVFGNISNELNNIANVSSSNENTNEETVKISSGDTITGKDVEINIDNMEFKQKVESPFETYFSEYYQVKDSDNTYLCIILDCKNTSTIDLDASSVAKVSVKYNNIYNYSSFSTIPDSSLGFTYSNITRIKPLTSQKIYYLAEMPKNIADEQDTSVEVNIKVDDKTYTYQYR